MSTPGEKEGKRAKSSERASRVGQVPCHLVGTDHAAGRSLKEVCREKPVGVKVWQAELSMFKGWGDQSEIKGQERG
jgi:hypothetical protein